MTEAPEIDASTRRAMREQMASAKPLHPHGHVSACHACGAKTMVWRHDLVVLAPTMDGLHTIHDISGGECGSCGEIVYDPAGLHRIDEALRGRDLVADYETRVTTVGRMAATYLKGDLARVMGLRPGQRLFWTPLDRDRALVRVDRGD